jgi:hypothetical protein
MGLSPDPLRVLQLHPVAERVVRIRDIDFQDVSPSINQCYQTTFPSRLRVTGVSLSDLVLVVKLSCRYGRQSTLSVLEYLHASADPNPILEVDQGDADVRREAVVTEHLAFEFAETDRFCHGDPPLVPSERRQKHCWLNNKLCRRGHSKLSALELDYEAVVGRNIWILIMAPGHRRQPVPGIERARGEAPSQRSDRKSGSSAARSVERWPCPSQETMMRFNAQGHRFYCGVDLHTRTSFVSTGRRRPR